MRRIDAHLLVPSARRRSTRGAKRIQTIISTGDLEAAPAVEATEFARPRTPQWDKQSVVKYLRLLSSEPQAGLGELTRGMRLGSNLTPREVSVRSVLRHRGGQVGQRGFESVLIDDGEADLCQHVLVRD